MGDVLRLDRKPTNVRDKFAIAVLQGSTVVGHMPYNIAPVVSHFLKRTVNKGLVEVTGARVNRGAGYGVEIPCKYRLYGTKDYIDRLQELITMDNIIVNVYRCSCFTFIARVASNVSPPTMIFYNCTRTPAQVSVIRE